MINIFKIKKLNALAKTNTARKKDKKTNTNTSLNGLNKDTFELRNNKTKDLTFKGKSKTLDDIYNKLLDPNKQFRLSDKKIKVLNDAFKGTESEKAKGLAIRIGVNCDNDIYDKLAEKVIEPLLRDENKALVSTGISIIGEIGSLPPNATDILDRFILSRDHILAERAIQALGDIGVKNPNDPSVKQIKSVIQIPFDAARDQSARPLLAAMKATREILEKHPNAQNFVDVIPSVANRGREIASYASEHEDGLILPIFDELDAWRKAYPRSEEVQSTYTDILSIPTYRDISSRGVRSEAISQQAGARAMQVRESGQFFIEGEGPSGS